MRYINENTLIDVLDLPPELINAVHDTGKLCGLHAPAHLKTQTRFIYQAAGVADFIYRLKRAGAEKLRQTPGDKLSVDDVCRITGIPIDTL